jgi:hypothetical protein
VKEEELVQLAERARRMAYRVRHLEEGRADSEQVARAWERLGEAAFALEAICARRFAFDPPRKSFSQQGMTVLADCQVQSQG